jgi:hypothetical protein
MKLMGGDLNASNYEEVGYFVLTPTEFEQTAVTLTVRLTVLDENDDEDVRI